MSIRPEVIPFLVCALAFGVIVGAAVRACRARRSRSVTAGVVVFVVFGSFFLFFFRDPDRVPPDPQDSIVASADGGVAEIAVLTPEKFAAAAAFAGLTSNRLERFQGGNVIRLSIFLSLFDVHVNRIPFAGKSTFLGYFPGKHFFTFQAKSSDYNQHNSVLVESEKTVCLINQIVGPVCRRVVYWLDQGKTVDVSRGEPFGMMKFGSRLDMYFPEQQVDLKVRKGDRVRAGLTVVATPRSSQP